MEEWKHHCNSGISNNLCNSAKLIRSSTMVDLWRKSVIISHLFFLKSEQEKLYYSLSNQTNMSKTPSLYWLFICKHGSPVTSEKTHSNVIWLKLKARNSNNLVLCDTQELFSRIFCQNSILFCWYFHELRTTCACSEHQKLLF